MGAKVTPLRPIRVLLAARDRRFLRAAAVLLAERGYVIRAIEKMSQVPAVALQWRANVVVLDVTGGVTSALRAAAAVEGAELPTGVVLVGDGEDAERVSAALKWDTLDELGEQVALSFHACRAEPGTNVAAG
jgi:DNA-binding NtrC family response regulator